jgi:hypothetical protein
VPLRKKTAKDQRELTQQYFKDWTDITEARRQFESKLFQQRLSNDAQVAQHNLDYMETLYHVQERQADYVRDKQIRDVEGADAQTIQQKVWVEQRKADIEVEYLRKTNEIKMKLFDMETRRQVMEEELTMQRLGYRADEIEARLAELNDQRSVIRGANQEGTDEAIAAAQQNAANRQTQMVREHFRSVYDSLKQQAGGVFDALLQKSQSVWTAIGNSFKTAMLTAIKEVVTSRVAAMLMQLFGMGRGGGYTPAAAGGGNSWGMLGNLGAILTGGGAPLAGGTGGGWGTPPFLPAESGSGASEGAFAGGFGNWGSTAASYKGWLSNLGNIGFRPERWRMDEMGNMTKLAGARGVGGWQGGAMLAGGSILAMDGLRRGGWLGVGETTAGGALIGAKFGGPLGAAIGAGIGFGVVRSPRSIEMRLRCCERKWMVRENRSVSPQVGLVIRKRICRTT